MFQSFGEYMFYLLFSPLKRGKQALNQFYIFFKVMGRSFDECKQKLFRIREEASVLTCSDVMLSVHGEDRDMLRLEGEALENYRNRLAMKVPLPKIDSKKIVHGRAEQWYSVSGSSLRL